MRKKGQTLTRSLHFLYEPWGPLNYVPVLLILRFVEFMCARVRILYNFYLYLLNTHTYIYTYAYMCKKKILVPVAQERRFRVFCTVLRIFVLVSFIVSLGVNI